MFKTDSKPLAHLNFLSGVNCFDIGSIVILVSDEHAKFETTDDTRDSDRTP